MATQGGAPKKFFFDGNALSGSIHSTYQLASLQTDQNPTLGQPNQQLDSRADDYCGSLLPRVTILHITHCTQSVAVLILG